MPTFVTQQTAARLRNDHLAKTLLQNGNRFGRQHVVFQPKHAYPSYVVKYRMVSYASTARNVVRVQSSTKNISVTVAGKYVYKKHPRTSGHLFVLVVVSVDTLKVVSTTVFNIHEVAGAKGMNEFISNFRTSPGEDILVVAATNRSMPRKLSPVTTDVLQSLRSVGGSLHVLDRAYVLVGAAHPCLLNGLVHEDHQLGKAAVTVDVRVIRYNRDTDSFNLPRYSNTSGDDMRPVRWQHQKNSRHGAMWQDLQLWSSQLTAAYQAGQVQVAIDGRTVDLVKMKMRSVNIRCLNWKGETLAPLSHPTNSRSIGVTEQS